MYKLMLIPLATIALSACSGSGGGSGDNAEPYDVSRNIDLQSSTTPASTTNPGAVAQPASLLLEVTDALNDYVDDLDELAALTSGSCRGGGSVDVSTVTAGGTVTRTLRFDDCIDDDEYRDGVLELSCAATGCAGDGSIRFGAAGAAYVEQDLDGNGRQSEVLDGTIGFTALSASRESGRLSFDLDAQFADAAGVIGAARLDDLRMEMADSGATEETRYDGTLQFTAFRTPSGDCEASGTLSIATAAPLVYDDGRDRTESGQLRLGQISPGDVTWSAGSVTAAGGGTTASYSERDFDRLCDF
ncbi:MAG TPA: hypothetical protein VGE51_17150 [Fontimonas sp.]